MPEIGRYEVLATLGQGAFGAVYEVRPKLRDERLALKLLLDATPEVRERFAREARVMEFLGRHPHVVKLRDVGEHAGRPFLVMNLARGGTLEKLLGANAPLAVTLPLLVDVARALHFAHEAGVVHRDLKPSNVLLDEAGRAVLSDFGLAKDAQAATLTKTGAFLGTLHYMAPEQVNADGRSIDRRTDVYALGAVLYQVLAGTTPFTGPQATLVKRILFDEPTPPGVVRAGVDPRLESLCLRALSKDPAARPATAEDVARELELCLGAPSAKLAPRRRLSRRREAFAAAPPLAVALVMGALLVSARRERALDRAHATVRERELQQELLAEKEKRSGLENALRETDQRHADTARALETAREHVTAPPSRAAALACAEARKLDGTGPESVEQRAWWVERAYASDLEVLLSAQDALAASKVLREAAVAALSSHASTAASVATARQRLLRGELLDPDPRDRRKEWREAAALLWQAGETTSAAVRYAARPWLPVGVERAGLHDLLAYDPPEKELQEANQWGRWPAPWTTLDPKLISGEFWRNDEIFAEVLLWHPELASIWHFYGRELRHVGRFGEAALAGRLACRFAPEALYNTELSYTYFWARDWKRAEAQLRVAIEQLLKLGNPNPWFERLILAETLVQDGSDPVTQGDEALELLGAIEDKEPHWDRFEKTLGSDPDFLWTRARAQELRGHPEMAGTDDRTVQKWCQENLGVGR